MASNVAIHWLFNECHQMSQVTHFLQMASKVAIDALLTKYSWQTKAAALKCGDS